VEDGEFAFELSGFNVRGDGEVGAVVVHNDAEAKAVFDAIGYTHLDVADSPYTYVLREVVPDDAQDAGGRKVKDGVTYDAEPRSIKVTLTDDLAGAVEVAVEGAERVSAAGAEAQLYGVAFANTYDAHGTAELKARKTLEGLSWPESKVFGFALEAASGVPAPPSSLVERVGSSSGVQSFGTIRYQLSDLSKTDADGVRYDDFTYTVRETLPEGVSAASPKSKGVTYDTSDHVVTVHVEDAGDGTLATSYDYGSDEGWKDDDDAALITIANSYEQEFSFVNVDEQNDKRLGGATLMLRGKFMRSGGLHYEGDVGLMGDGGEPRLHRRLSPHQVRGVHASQHGLATGIRALQACYAGA
jgi:hypothetical protein